MAGVKLPFTVEEFLGVFAAYNHGIWPAQIVLYLIGVALVVAAVRGAWPRWAVPAGLALLWAWMGAVYQLRYFAEVNPAARLFGAAFLLQAVLWLVWARRTPALQFRPRGGAPGTIGTVLCGYAFVIYPSLNLFLGHAYPIMPTFGAPCPTTIATLGLLAWAAPRPPWFVWVVPVLWTLVGTSAAFVLGVREDLALAPAGILAIAVQLRSGRRPSQARGSPPRGRAGP